MDDSINESIFKKILAQIINNFEITFANMEITLAEFENSNKNLVI